MRAASTPKSDAICGSAVTMIVASSVSMKKAIATISDTSIDRPPTIAANLSLTIFLRCSGIRAAPKSQARHVLTLSLSKAGR
ncbi:hypothetical protein [Sphingobium sp. CAP-1]|uniref:hypothetical protein n=1 Tax=Sphingobium sp. CAP-1 TaxID=2676077 RepID=UPI001E609719|nr:hypothetical protein [Sphingobium sp. CAP-1]